MLKKIAGFLLGTLAVAFIMAAPACSHLGVPQPQNSQEQIVVTLATVAGVRDAAATLLTAKKISVADAQNIQMQADNVRVGVMLAQSMLAEDPAGADAKLRQTRAALAALQAYLATKEKQR